jgi:hypothetical protein
MKNCKIQVFKSSDSICESDGNKSRDLQEGLLKPKRYTFNEKLTKGSDDFLREDEYSKDKPDEHFYSSKSRFFVNVIRPPSNLKSYNQEPNSGNLESMRNFTSKEKSQNTSSKHRVPNADHPSKTPSDRQDHLKKSPDSTRRHTNLIRLPIKSKDQKRNTIVSDSSLLGEVSQSSPLPEVTAESISHYRNFLKKAIKSSQSKRRIQAQGDLYTRYQNIINFIPTAFKINSRDT